MRLLLSGDLHMGRLSTRVPAAYRDAARASTAWNRMVDKAIEKRVDLVCLSGDVVDQKQRFWEFAGSFESGLRRLARNGIETLAVSGNHDHELLPRLADQLEPSVFRLVGREGCWSRTTIERSGRPVLHVDGWCFPGKRVREDPLRTYPRGEDSSIPVLGMVHGDVDAPDSPYAPLSSSLLQQLPVSAWLLGHIHAPRCEPMPGERWWLYPGSLQALDPGEPDLHGAWICEVREGHLTQPVFMPISSVCYLNLNVNLDGAEDLPEAESRILKSIRAELDRIHEKASGPTEFVNLRLQLTGRTQVAKDLRAVAQKLEEQFSLPFTEFEVEVAAADVQVLPAIDLDKHRTSNSAPGFLIRLLDSLDEQQPPIEVRRLLSQTR